MTTVTKARERRVSVGVIARPALLYAALAAGALLTLSPLIWTLLSSFKPSVEVLGAPTRLIAEHPTVGNYLTLLSDPVFVRYAINSIVVTAATVIGNILLSAMVGYALAKLDFPGRRAVFAGVLVTFMIPGVVMFVPLFATVSTLGLANSYPGIILPFIVMPLSVFIMRQFMLGVPTELIEAARVDGAGELRIFARIALPLMWPAMATVGILSFMSSWNNLLWPLVVAQSQDMYTLPVGLAFQAQGDASPDYGLMLAGSVITIAPIVIMFLFFQRYFITGIATTGLK